MLWIVWFWSLICLLPAIFSLYVDDSGLLWWALYCAAFPPIHFAQYVRRITMASGSGLVPRFRRCQWRAFMIVIAIVLLCPVLDLVANGLNVVAAVSIVALIGAVAVWLSTSRRPGYAGLLFLPLVALIYTPSNDVTSWVGWANQNISIAPAGFAVAVILFLLAHKRYLNGAVRWEKVTPVTERRLIAPVFTAIGRLRTRIDNRLYLWPEKTDTRRQYVRPLFSTAWFSPVVGSTIGIVLSFTVLGLIAGLPGYFSGNPHATDSALIVGSLGTSVIASMEVSSFFLRRGYLWATFWLVAPEDGRHAMMQRGVAMYLRAQFRVWLVCACCVFIEAFVVHIWAPWVLLWLASVCFYEVCLVSMVTVMSLAFRRLQALMDDVGALMIVGIAVFVSAMALYDYYAPFSSSWAMRALTVLALMLASVGLIRFALRRLDTVEVMALYYNKPRKRL